MGEFTNGNRRGNNTSIVRIQWDIMTPMVVVVVVVVVVVAVAVAVVVVAVVVVAVVAVVAVVVVVVRFNHQQSHQILRASSKENSES